MGLFDYDPYSQFSLDPQGSQYDRLTRSVSPYWEPDSGNGYGDALASVAPPAMTPEAAPGIASGFANTFSQPSALPAGLPAEPGGNGGKDVDGSLTSAQSRMLQSTGFTAIASMDPGQSAKHKIDPLDILTMPFRAIGLVDRSLKTALGLKTQGDAAKSAAEYLKYGQDNQWQGFDRISPGAAEGMNQQLGGGMGNPLDFLTGARQGQERQVIDAARQAQARRAEWEQQVQLGTAQANQGYAETRNAWEPRRLEQAFTGGELENQGKAFDVGHQADTYELNRRAKEADIRHLGFLDAGGDPTTRSLRGYQLERERLTMPATEGDYAGMTPAQIQTARRQAVNDQRAEERMNQSDTRIGQADQRLVMEKVGRARKATNIEEARQLLEGTDFDAEPTTVGKGLDFLHLPGGDHFNVVPRRALEADAAPTAAPAKRTSSSQPMAAAVIRTPGEEKIRTLAKGELKKKLGREPTEMELDHYLSSESEQ